MKYDVVEMLEFFEDNPISIGDFEGGDLIYSLRGYNQFVIVLTLSTYGKEIDISLTFEDNVVFSESYNDVSEIKKNDNDSMVILMENGKRALIKKGKQLGIIVE